MREEKKERREEGKRKRRKKRLDERGEEEGGEQQENVKNCMWQVVKESDQRWRMNFHRYVKEIIYEYTELLTNERL